MFGEREAKLSQSNRWWCEVQVAWLVLLVLVGYLPRANALALRGEEPTRAQIAVEMLDRGDWIVPYDQGEVFRSRPPLHNWFVGVTALVCGSWAAPVIRLPSILAILYTTILIYGYARISLSRLGALAAAAIFPTLGDIFSLGCQSETEAVYIALLSSSLLLWHWGQLRGWPEFRSWAVGYVFVGLAALTKGLSQPCVYFGAAVGLDLILRGRWRRLFAPAHFAGILVGAAVILAWAIPCALRVGMPMTYAMLMSDTTSRFQFSSWDVSETLWHLINFPCDVFACTLPWSLLLLAYLVPDVRRSIGNARPAVRFCTICLAVAFPTCWIPAGGRERYFAPLYPCLAFLLGTIVERGADLGSLPAVRAVWRRYVTGMAVAMLLAALVLVALPVVASYKVELARYVEPPLVVGAVAAVCSVAALVLLRMRRSGGSLPASCAVLIVAGFAVLMTGVVYHILGRISENAPLAMSRIKEKLPPGQELVSIDGPTHRLFTFLYGPPIIRRHPWPAPENGLGADLDYFCFQVQRGKTPALPFTWEEIGRVSLDRNHHRVPDSAVVVGRRILAETFVSPEAPKDQVLR